MVGEGETSFIPNQEQPSEAFDMNIHQDVPGSTGAELHRTGIQKIMDPMLSKQIQGQGELMNLLPVNWKTLFPSAPEIPTNETGNKSTEPMGEIGNWGAEMYAAVAGTEGVDWKKLVETPINEEDTNQALDLLKAAKTSPDKIDSFNFRLKLAQAVVQFLVRKDHQQGDVKSQENELTHVPPSTTITQQ